MRVLREGPVKITLNTIEKAARRRAPGQRLVIGDADCGGLALVVNTGGLNWRFDYRPRGIDSTTGKRFASQSVVLGTPEKLNPDEARREARRLKGEAQAGNDPARIKREERAAQALQRSQTVERMVEAYAEALPKRQKLRGKGKPSANYVASEVARVKAAVRHMGCASRSVADISEAEVRKLLEATSDLPGAAREQYTALHRFFDWCIDERAIAANPCLRIPKERRPKAVEPRKHFLLPDQLAVLWKAAGEVEDFEAVHRDFLRFMIAVPTRKTETTKIQWSHVDLELGVLKQPQNITKNGEPHTIHLPPLALAILRERHEAAGKPKTGLVFPAPRSNAPLTTHSFMKRELDKQSGITGWVVHDFRRSFATALGEAGVAEAVADAILNHRQAATRGGVLGVYQRAVRWPEQMKAMQIWGDMLTAAIEGRPAGAKVHRLTAA